ncbi:Trp biosynthesis-associated membrane protein [Rhizomonospora bruguierae]|uniref:Trp biosynthesis-associated membrane protein n=1 Tax=Rhizomonospora bruguierae TaxID=1581705 RepID=UPI001BCBF81A|nr:Trp biosynthesis-associated membrane protein [Micromonospora sp. NBRC 107566]
MDPRRQRVYAVLACAVGGALALWAAGRVWTVEVVARPEPLTPLRTERTGGALVGWLAPLAVVAIAGAGALFATGRRGRGLVGGLLVLEGLAIVAAGGSGLTRADRPAWPVVAALGGLLVAAAGALAVVRGRAWPTMGGRYERRAETRPAAWSATSQDMWNSLDRGEDPTLREPPRAVDRRAPEDS